MYAKIKSFYRNHKILTYSLIAAIVVLIVCLATILWVPEWKGDDAGIFGDMFGGANAFFSGLAFVGLVSTLLMQHEQLKMQHEELKMQREELQLTREEIKNTTEELKGQKEEVREQNKTLRQQRFETTFFNMPTLHQEIVNNLSLEIIYNKDNNREKVLTQTGRQVFTQVYQNSHYINRRPVLSIKGIILNTGKLSSFNSHQSISTFDHYFRNLYEIINFVDTTILIEEQQKCSYIYILRAVLSNCELAMLFYHGLAGEKSKKIKPLLEKYSIFENLRQELLADKTHSNLYDQSAYSHN